MKERKQYVLKISDFLNKLSNEKTIFKAETSGGKYSILVTKNATNDYTIVESENGRHTSSDYAENDKELISKILSAIYGNKRDRINLKVVIDTVNVSKLIDQLHAFEKQIIAENKLNDFGKNQLYHMIFMKLLNKNDIVTIIKKIKDFYKG